MNRACEPSRSPAAHCRMRIQSISWHHEKARPRRMNAPVALVNMPWPLLRYPSIQLSTVKALLAQRNIGAHVLNFNLAWLERLVDAGFAIADYDNVVNV